jgi:hypothetical protein
MVMGEFESVLGQLFASPFSINTSRRFCCIAGVHPVPIPLRGG